MPLDAAFYRDDGSANVPGENSPWEEWVSAGRTRNFCHRDPCLDWLEAHGEHLGFVRDSGQVQHDPRTDFIQYVFRKAREFEGVVMDHLRNRHHLVEVAKGREDVLQRESVERVWALMQSGCELIAQAPLWNPENQTYGMPDLLVRSDLLSTLFPEALPHEDGAKSAPDIPGSAWHYRIVDIKFTTLHLLKDGHASSSHLPYMAQVWTYNEALGRLQGFAPEAAYLLGRAWQWSTKARGSEALDRLARVDHEHSHRGLGPLREIVNNAAEWIRRVRRDGVNWEALPEPTVEELRPNMRNNRDYPWHAAKATIATELNELTMLPRVGPSERATARQNGIRSWTDPACSAENCGVTSTIYGGQLDTVIAANQSPQDGAILFPARVTAGEERWRLPAPTEFFVDFETVNDLDDDFSRFPRKDGQALIFMIGCGRLVGGEWVFREFTVSRLLEAEEGRIINEWLDHVRVVCAENGSCLEDARLYHWSPAETSTLATAYNSAVARHGVPAWRELPWVDLLAEVARKQPLGVLGAFGFGLKGIAKALHRQGLISTVWGDGPTDGLGAMAGAWWCNEEAAREREDMRSFDLMREIIRYNEVDCRVMSELLEFLRASR